MKLCLYRDKQQIKNKTICEKMSLPEIKIIVDEIDDCESSHDNDDFMYRYILYRF